MREDRETNSVACTLTDVMLYAEADKLNHVPTKEEILQVLRDFLSENKIHYKGYTIEVDSHSDTKYSIYVDTFSHSRTGETKQLNQKHYSGNIESMEDNYGSSFSDSSKLPY